MRLNGKQTIYQMIQLADEVRRRGGTPLDPLEYKRQYHDLLWQRIAGRIAGLKDGTLNPDDLTLPGSHTLLERLRARDLQLYLASGTDLPYVQNEARALGLDAYFGERIYGALDAYESFSKAMIVQQILAENDLKGEELLAFGDGFVEIEEVKRVGGVAVGVASDEVRRRGVNEWKRNRLIRAGADLIVPEYRQQEQLLAYLFDE
jgi:phosphoglycolate phosphatase